MSRYTKEPILIVVKDELLNPPSMPFVFRDLTLYQATYFNDDFVIETNKPDVYSSWLRRSGGLDFVRGFVRVGTEDRGLRLDTEHGHGITVRVDRITDLNLWMIIRMIGFKRHYV